MSRAKRLEPVQDIVDDKERRLAQSLAGHERRVAEMEAKLQDLQRYRGEYEQQFNKRAGKGIGATDLRDYQVFLSRLSDAIRQQQAVVQRTCADRDAERLRWQEAARRAKALDHVVERWQLEEQKTVERREQRETDERAQHRRSDQTMK
jgi:flagellar FliJ protein